MGCNAGDPLLLLWIKVDCLKRRGYRIAGDYVLWVNKILPRYICLTYHVVGRQKKANPPHVAKRISPSHKMTPYVQNPVNAPTKKGLPPKRET